MPVDIIPIQGITGYEEITVWRPGFPASNSVLQRHGASAHFGFTCRDNALPAAHDLVYSPSKLADFLLSVVSLERFGRFAGKPI
jgi:hypothetical protein